MLDGLTVREIVIVTIFILISMAVHEATHAWVSLKLGDDTAAQEGRISLNPFAHVDPFTTMLLPIITLVLFQAPILAARPVPFNAEKVKFEEFGAALMAFAGPVSNLMLAIVVAFISNHIGLNSIIYEVLMVFVVINVSLFVFNLIPIPPLDGSRVLYAFAPRFLQQLMEQVEPYGLFIVFGIVILGGFGGVLSTVIQFVLNALP